MSYDAENRLTTVSGPVTANFKYDGDRQRIWATINGGLDTVFIGNYFEWNVATQTKKTYYYSGATRIAMREGSGDPQWILGDHLGSTSKMVSYAGADTGGQWYKAWGETRLQTGTIPTKYQYTGQYNQVIIGLYYYGARWYDPALSRFTQPDTDVPESQDGEGLDRYAYVANNPLVYNDPGGHCWGVASAIRGIPSYDITCNNLDMALSIVQNPKTSPAEKAIAGAYIGTEAAAHAALVIGAAALACGAVAACTKVVEGALGIGSAACADGNCTNEVELSAKLGQDIWQMNPLNRGVTIENALGHNLPPNYPTIDNFNFTNGIATSIKSINLAAKSYQNIGVLTSVVKGYITKLVQFDGAPPWGGYTITSSMIKGRELILAIQQNATAEQMAILQQLKEWAATQGVSLVMQVIK